MTDDVIVRRSEPAIHARLARATPHDHIVQFYEDESALVDNIVRFAAAGLERGEPVVVIATARRRDTIAVRLLQRGLDVDAACARGQLVVLDASDVLATFMTGDVPSWDHFRHTVGRILDNSARAYPGTCVRAYGEMVDVLWRNGLRAAAIRLECFWNDLADRHSFSLLCAYAMGNFFRAGDAEQLEQICRTHSHVIACDDAVSDTPDDRARELLVLRQRARALEAEVSHRAELERALRDALAREQAARLDAEQRVRSTELLTDLIGQELGVLGKPRDDQGT